MNKAGANQALYLTAAPIVHLPGQKDVQTLTGVFRPGQVFVQFGHVSKLGNRKWKTETRKSQVRDYFIMYSHLIP
jgi:hypothetical protein